MRGGGGCLGGGQCLIRVGLGSGGVGYGLLCSCQFGLGRLLLLGNCVINLLLGGSGCSLLGGGVLVLGGQVGGGLGCISLGLGGCGLGGLGGGIGVGERFHLGVVIGLELVVFVLVGFLFRIGGVENLLFLGDRRCLSLFLGFIGFLEAVIGLFLLVGLCLEIIGVVGDLALGEGELAFLAGKVELEVALAAQLGDLRAVGGVPNLGGVVLAGGGKLGSIRADGHGEDGPAVGHAANLVAAVGIPVAHGPVIAAGKDLRVIVGHAREGKDRLAVALHFFVGLQACLGGGFLGGLGLVGLHLGGVGHFLGVNNGLGSSRNVGLCLGVGGLGVGEGLGLVGGGLHGGGLGALSLGESGLGGVGYLALVSGGLGGSVLLGLLFVGVAGNFLGVGLGGLGGVVSIGKVGLRLGGGSLGSGDGLAGIGVGLGCRC